MSTISCTPLNMSAEVNKEIFTAIPHPYSYDSWGPNLEAVIVDTGYS